MSGGSRNMKAISEGYAGFMVHGNVTLMYQVVQDLRAHLVAWKCVLRGGIITKIDISGYGAPRPSMQFHVDYNLAKPWGVSSGLRLGEVKLVDKANIIFVETESWGDNGLQPLPLREVSGLLET